MKARLIHNIGYDEAEALLLRQGFLKPGFEIVWEDELRANSHAPRGISLDSNNERDDMLVEDVDSDSQVNPPL